jgi:hypothetical protein
MPNPHNRKSFQEALAKVEINDKLLTEAYAIADQEKMTDKQLREFFEILGGLAAGAAIAAPAIATGVGMYRKAKKEEQQRQDTLNTEAQNRATEERRAAEDIEQKRLGREHTTSERQAGEAFTKAEKGKDRRQTAAQKRLDRKQQSKLAKKARKSEARSRRENTVVRVVTDPRMTAAQLAAAEAKMRSMGLM